MLQGVRRFSNRWSDRHWEMVGIGVGLIACTSIVIQMVHEYRSPDPSTLSWFFLAGFALVYSFWFFYGLKFNHVAVWIPNGLASILQLLLVLCVLTKQAH